MHILKNYQKSSTSVNIFYDFNLTAIMTTNGQISKWPMGSLDYNMVQHKVYQIIYYVYFCLILRKVHGNSTITI